MSSNRTWNWSLIFIVPRITRISFDCQKGHQTWIARMKAKGHKEASQSWPSIVSQRQTCVDSSAEVWGNRVWERSFHVAARPSIVFQSQTSTDSSAEVWIKRVWRRSFHVAAKQSGNKSNLLQSSHFFLELCDLKWLVLLLRWLLGGQGWILSTLHEPLPDQVILHLLLVRIWSAEAELTGLVHPFRIFSSQLQDQTVLSSIHKCSLFFVIILTCCLLSCIHHHAHPLPLMIPLMTGSCRLAQVNGACLNLWFASLAAGGFTL